jgi:hypothetical protein
VDVFRGQQRWAEKGCGVHVIRLRDRKRSRLTIVKDIYAKGGEIWVVGYEDVVGMRVEDLRGGFWGCLREGRAETGVQILSAKA